LKRRLRLNVTIAKIGRKDLIARILIARFIRSGRGPKEQLESILPKIIKFNLWVKSMNKYFVGNWHIITIDKDFRQHRIKLGSQVDSGFLTALFK